MHGGIVVGQDGGNCVAVTAMMLLGEILAELVYVAPVGHGLESCYDHGGDAIHVGHGGIAKDGLGVEDVLEGSA